MKKKFNIEGMSCAACAQHVSKAVNSLENVSCKVNLLTNSMEVTYDENIHTDTDIINAVVLAGYNAKVYENTYVKSQEKSTNVKIIKLIISSILMLVLMYVSMGHMLNLPIIEVLKHNKIFGNLIVQIVLSLTIIGINFNYYISGFSKLFKLKPNMDSLVSLGSVSALIYSIYNTILVFTNNNHNQQLELIHNLYYDSSAMILTIVSIGKYLESLSKKRATKSLDLLMDLLPDTVYKKIGDMFEYVACESINVGDIFEVKPYDVIPIDGVVVSGESNVDESTLTGESLAVAKKVDDFVYSGSNNQSGRLLVKATKTYENSTMSEIIKMVEKTSESKMKLERLADKVSLYFVPVVILISLITFIFWYIFDGSNVALNMMISVLVVSCPCALGLATPLCVMISTLVSSKNQILVKEASVYETLFKVDTIFFDKTGTITDGKMTICENTLSDEDMKILVSLESKSNHPLANVILSLYKGNLYDVINSKTIIGLGISGDINDIVYYAGSEKLVNNILGFTPTQTIVGTYVYLFNNETIIGYIVLKDKVKSDAKKTIELFKQEGIKTVMLTGDNEQVAKDIANTVGIEEVYSSLLPIDKANIIQKYKKEHVVLMVGDGINDSVALESAHVGVAMNETNIARSSADIILTKNKILDVYNIYSISKKTVKNIKINLFWAFIYNIIMLPVTAGLLYKTFNIKMTPMLGSICMSLSSICVCLNALRLNNIKLERKNTNMKFYVKDMMCMKCVKHVTEALNVEGISDVCVTLEDKSVKLNTEKSLNEVFELLINAGYEPSEN